MAVAAVFILVAAVAASDTEMGMPSPPERLTPLLSALAARAVRRAQTAILLTPVPLLVAEPVTVETVAAAILAQAAVLVGMAIKAAAARVATLGMAVMEAAILLAIVALAVAAVVAVVLTTTTAALAAAAALVFLAKELVAVVAVTATLAWALHLVAAAVLVARMARPVPIFALRHAHFRSAVEAVHTGAARDAGRPFLLFGPQVDVVQSVLFGLAALVARHLSHQPMLEHKIWNLNSTFKSLTGTRKITL